MKKNQTTHSKDLPPTEDKKFWGSDAEVAVAKPPRTKLTSSEVKNCRVENGYVVCTANGFDFSLPVKPDDVEIKDGIIVAIKKSK